MNRTTSNKTVAAVVLAASLTSALVLTPSWAQVNVDTAFTYQGRLTSGGAPVTGTCDFEFSLWNASTAGSQIGSTQQKYNVAVTAGYFTIPDLNFGAGAFNGEARWLSIGVRCPAGSGSFTSLAPRQPLRAVPYAHSLRPGTNVVGASGGLATIFVRNTSTAAGSHGVWGSTDAPGGYGVIGTASHPNGFAVYGVHEASTGTTAGVHGVTRSTSNDANGVYGEVQPTNAGLPLTGVRGVNNSTNNEVFGVVGEIVSTNPGASSAGVRGINRGTGLSGFGVWGSHAGSGFGVYGTAAGTSGWGVYGLADASNGTTYGVRGRVFSSAIDSAGVQGQAETGRGVHGISARGTGVFGEATATSGAVTFGVYGLSRSPASPSAGVVGDGHNGALAGLFLGNVNVTGNLSVTGTLAKGAGAFKIDHPLDPENKYLYHSFVESPDMKNIYDGVVVLDANGEAWVTLPNWFEALNIEYRYQLTPIGAAMPNLHIAQEIQNNRFKVAGGVPNGKVSWQVTGIRNDPYARMYRIPVEADKPAGERGTYLHPEAYGQPAERGLDYLHSAALRQAAGQSGGDR